MKRLLLLIGLLVFLPISFTHAQDLNHTNTVIKITIKDTENETFLGFFTPNNYIYRIGNEEISGTAAKDAVKRMVSALHLSPDTTADEIVNRIQSLDDHDLQHIEVDWLDSNNQLYTWVWSKSN